VNLFEKENALKFNAALFAVNNCIQLLME